MASVRSKNTGPELVVRKLLHRLGYRFRIHRADLPGKPDIVLPRHRIALLVHGCFWHRHGGCPKASIPKSRQQYWLEKFARNLERDFRVNAELRKLGWHVEIVWQCETRDASKLADRLSHSIDQISEHRRLTQ